MAYKLNSVRSLLILVDNQSYNFRYLMIYILLNCTTKTAKQQVRYFLIPLSRIFFLLSLYFLCLLNNSVRSEYDAAFF